MRSVKHGGRIGHATSDDPGSGGSCNSRTRCPRGRLRWKQQEELEHDDGRHHGNNHHACRRQQGRARGTRCDQAKGTLIVAADAHYAPDEFIGADGRTVEGMDPDLAKALAAVMGLKVKVVNASLSTIIPGLSSGKYDLGISSITDTKRREKTVEFVTYFEAGTSFYTNTTGGLVIQNGLADLCGPRGTGVRLNVEPQAEVRRELEPNAFSASWPSPHDATSSGSETHGAT